MSTVPSDNYERFETGRPYHFFTPQFNALVEDREQYVRAYNATTDSASREEAGKKLFKTFGEGSIVVPPVWAEWGTHTSIGKESYIGPNATFLDTGPVIIGDRALIGPSLHALTNVHPIDPSLRLGTLGIELHRPVTIGNDVWIGGNVTLLPGVTIGNGCTIGAGSVVTNSTGEREVWYGNPARMMRKVGDKEDRIDWKE